MKHSGTPDCDPDRPPAGGAGDRYHRQSLFSPLGAAGTARIRRGAALMVGCGALGSHVAVLLTRAGVGTLRLVDRDVVDWTNLHRQVEFTEADAREGVPKAVALASHLEGANSEVRIEPVVTDFNPRTARKLARDVNVMVDGTDNLPARFLLNDLSLALGIPWIYGGAVGEEAHAQLFAPGRGPCLRCVVRDLPPAGSLPTCDTAGVVGPAPAAAASFQAALTLRYLADPESAGQLAGRWVRLRLWEMDATTAQVEPDPGCPACRSGDLDFLEGREGEDSVALCGRGAVQVLPAASHLEDSLSLEALARRLAACGTVERKPFLIRFQPAGGRHRITIFGDGRAIIDGTTDIAQARALYDRYIGQ